MSKSKIGKIKMELNGKGVAISMQGISNASQVFDALVGLTASFVKTSGIDEAGEEMGGRDMFYKSFISATDSMLEQQDQVMSSHKYASKDELKAIKKQFRSGERND